MGWLVCVLTTLVLTELAAANSLLRIRTFMISVVYLLTMAVCGFLHSIGIGHILALILAVAFYTLFRSYEKRVAATDSFHTALCLSIGSLVWAPFLLLAPVLLWGQGAFLRGLSWRVLSAWLIGLLLPYWFWAPAAYLWSDMTVLTNHLADIISPFQEPLYWQPTIEDITAHIEAHRAEAAAAAFVLLMGLTGFFHYLRNNYDDKIGVRMFYYCLMLTQMVLLLWLVLQPTAFYKLFPMFILTTAPTAAHFFALTHSWITNAWFILCCIALIGVAFYNLQPDGWVPFF